MLVFQASKYSLYPTDSGKKMKFSKEAMDDWAKMIRDPKFPSFKQWVEYYGKLFCFNFIFISFLI